MVGGRQEFTTQFPRETATIEADSAIEADVASAFWAAVDAWDGVTDIADHLHACCHRFSFRGPEARLADDEQLGTAQAKDVLKRTFATSVPRGSALPAPTPSQVDHWLNEVLRTSDDAAALALFKARFGRVRLRPVGTPERRGRIFAMRNPRSRTNPWSSDPVRTFHALAIPNADPSDYIQLAFQPRDGDEVRQPTALDAGFRNLSKFVPGGKTAGGIDEVVVTPPLCDQVTRAPRDVG